ncbi:methyl-accepting chemotaxis protein [Pseudooceanicola sp. HF7]|uniref:methyl-accepting chemotaxis protein n=1 Tax=Pseudooceanicola sp. HF7 TaxID=2721560 RepID=UPI00142FC097|nr:methyl-accepting chemotaxis protein [Pseudooceanicola sp. HF7]NIZ08866.1 hypothetical protein [Pseudooceanicola sp. HF7]
MITPETLGPRFEKHRQLAMRIVAWVTAVSVIAVAGAAVLTGSNATWAIVAFSLVLTGIGFGALRMSGAQGRVVLSLALIGQCILLNAAMIGHPMQADSHLFYFTALTAIATLSSRPALLAALAVIVAHHLLASVFFPALAFPTADLWYDIMRSGFHAVAAALAVGNLVLIVNIRLLQTVYAERRAMKLEEAMEESEQALATAERKSAEALEEKSRAEEALSAAARSQTEAEAALRNAEENAAAARRAEEQTEETRRKFKAEIDEVIAHLQEKLFRLAEGDLTTRIERPLPPAFAELSQSFNLGVARLEGALAEVRNEVVSIQVQSQEINDAAADLGQRTEKQVKTLTEAASTLQQLTTLITEIAGDTRAARQATEETRSEAASGTDVMTNTVSAMDKIEQSSSEVRKIITVIDDIAFQTNLLALNAGVEAARAGEAGRGFAVVANEVRALAQRSSNAAKEIDELISGSAGHVADGVGLVKNTGNALSSIRDAVERTAERIQAVSEATNEQSRGLTEVNAAISELESFTQNNAAIFEETQSANAVLFKTTKALSERIAQFRIKDQPDTGCISDYAFDSRDLGAASA